MRNLGSELARATQPEGDIYQDVHPTDGNPRLPGWAGTSNPGAASPQVAVHAVQGSIPIGGGRESNPPDGDRPSQPL